MNSRGYSRCRVRRVWSINPFVQRKHRGSRARESPSGRVTTFTHTGAHVRRRDARRAPPPRGRARRGSARTSAARLRSEANLIPATRLHGNSPRARDKRQPRRGHEKKKKSEKKKRELIVNAKIYAKQTASVSSRRFDTQPSNQWRDESILESWMNGRDTRPPTSISRQFLFTTTIGLSRHPFFFFFLQRSVCWICTEIWRESEFFLI